MRKTVPGTLAGVLLACLAAGAQEQPRTGAPQTERTRSDLALLERGRYLVETAAFCGACHTTHSLDGRMLPGMDLARGRVMADRGFQAVTPNITPDAETGIGRWTDVEIANAIRHGRRPDGSIIGPPMPVEFYHGISDRDVAAIVAYLRTVPPVHHTVTEKSTYPFPLADHGPLVASVSDPPDDPVARGAYLAGPIAHCMDCHTPELPGERRDLSRLGAGGVPFGGPWGIVPSRNITPHKEYGIGEWTNDQIRRALIEGVSVDGKRFVPPMGARAPIFARLTERDMGDLIAFLRSLPPQEPP